MGRAAVYVSSLSGGPVDASISALIQRGGVSVREVHLAARPPSFLFAIVAIEGDESEARKCAKLFNNCLWAGRKIRVEVAREFYRDKLLREKREEEEEESEKQLSALKAVRLPSLPSFSSSVLRIRRNKAVPVMEVSLSKLPSKHVTFEEEGNHHQQQRQLPLESMLQSSESGDLVRSSKEESSSSSSAHEEQRHRDLQGGGARRGFGKLLKASSADLEAKVAGKKQWSYDYDEGYGATNGEEDLQLPAVSLADVKEEALERERLRSLAILQSILLKPEKNLPESTGTTFSAYHSQGGSVFFFSSER